MANIVKVIKDENFISFIGLKNFFEEKNIDVKEKDSLYMLCFTELSDITQDYIRECNGIILEKNTNKIVHYTFPKCYDAFDHNTSVIDTDLIAYDDNGKYSVNWFIDGSVIKLFYYNEKWNIATSRNIDGSKNRWSSQKTFEVLFQEAIHHSHFIEYTSFLESLDKDCSYSYIIQHPEHTTATTSVGHVPVAVLLNIVNNNTLVEELPEHENFKINKTVDEIVSSDRQVTDNFLVYKYDESGNILARIKLLSPSFIKLKETFGNLPNIGLRYLEIEDKQLLRNTFPDNKSIYDEIDIKFSRICKHIHLLYMHIHVRKNHLEYDPKYTRILYQMHTRYRQTKNPITVSDIKTKLEEVGCKNPRALANIINFRY